MTFSLYCVYIALFGYAQFVAPGTFSKRFPVKESLCYNLAFFIVCTLGAFTLLVLPLHIYDLIRRKK